MSIPAYQSLMLPVLSASLDGEIRISDVVKRLAEKLCLMPEERSQLLPSGKQIGFRHVPTKGQKDRIFGQRGLKSNWATTDRA